MCSAPWAVTITTAGRDERSRRRRRTSSPLPSGSWTSRRTMSAWTAWAIPSAAVPDTLMSRKPCPPSTAEASLAWTGSSSTMRIRKARLGTEVFAGVEADPGEFPPADLPAPRVELPAEPPVEAQRPPQERLEHRIAEHDREFAPLRVRHQAPLQRIGEPVPEPPRPDEDRQEVHEHRVDARDQQEGEEEGPRDDRAAARPAEEKSGRNEKVAEQLVERAVVLEGPEGGERDAPDPTEAGPEEHRPMVHEALPEPAMPAAPLLAERIEALGHLGPGDGVRGEPHG